MALEEKKDAAASEQQPKNPNDQQDLSKDAVPAEDGQSGHAENDANKEQKEKKFDDFGDDEAQKDDNVPEGTDDGEGDEGDPQNPSQNGISPQQTHENNESNSALNKIRLDAEKAAKKMSFNPTGMHINSIWGNKTYRASTGLTQNELGWIRVGDKGYWVNNPSKKFLEAPFGCPVLVNLSNYRKGKVGLTLPSNAVVVFDKQKMDLMHIEANKAAAGVQENTEADLIFEQNFSHCYYGSNSRNLLRGRTCFDTDTKKVAVMTMEFSHAGKWLKGNMIPINIKIATCKSPLKIGMDVLFSTAIWGNSVIAHHIFPCALMSSAETETNTRASLPIHYGPEGEKEFVSLLRATPNKTLGTHNLKLLYRELWNDKKTRIGDEKWDKLDDLSKNPVDVIITDSDFTDHQDSLKLSLTPLLLHFQELGAQSSTPLCWDYLKLFCPEEKLDELDRKVSATGIGLSIVVETYGALQKTVLEWAKTSVADAVAARSIDPTKAFTDSIGVTYSFGPSVTASNFNETVNDNFFEVDNSIGLQNIKIFDHRVPAQVSFATDNGEITVDTDLATRGLVVFALEAVSKKVSETDRLISVRCEEERPASKFFNNDKVVQIKFRTTQENILFLDKLKREFHLNFFYDHNPASRYVGKNPKKSFRTVKFSTVCWQEEQFLGFLNEIHAQQNTDFFVMRLEDMIGGNSEDWTSFTLGTEDFRTSKVLAALRLRLPLMQMMGMNGFLTRISVKGSVTIESIEAAVHSISKTIPNAIKMVVFNNTIRRYNQREERSWARQQNFQPHYTQYVVALAGFPCPLSEAEVIGFLELADVDVSGAKLTWFASEDDFVLQITTSQTDQIEKLREREGGQHDITTFLKWTSDLSQTLRYVATLGQKLVVEKDPNNALPQGKSPLSNREISAIVQDNVHGTNAERAHSVPAEAKVEEWTQVNNGRKKKVPRALSGASSFPSSSSPPSTHAGFVCPLCEIFSSPVPSRPPSLPPSRAPVPPSQFYGC